MTIQFLVWMNSWIGWAWLIFFHDNGFDQGLLANSLVARVQGYYRRFIPAFSELTSPLTDLTQKGASDGLAAGGIPV